MTDETPAAPATPADGASPEAQRAPDAPQPSDATPQAEGDPQSPEDAPAGGARRAPDVFVGSPAKVMRIGTMVKQLLEEVRSAPLDDAARARLAEVHDRSLQELASGLSEDLVAELQRITLPFSDDTNPSDAELRIAQAQLVGWLEGLFHGLQTALVAQQMTTQAQLAARRALPPGMTLGEDEQPPTVVRREDRPGQYL